MTPDMQKSLVDALGLPAMLLTPDLRICFANERANSLFETPLDGIDFVRVLQQPDARNCLQQALETHLSQTVKAVLTFNTPRTFEMTAGVVQAQANEKYVLFTLLDVSAEIAAERSRSTFVANVSHELRSPLTALMGAVETLQGPAREDANARDKFLDLMHTESQRMSRLVGDLLSLAKLESKEHLPPDDEVDIIRILKQVESSLSASRSENIGRIMVRSGNDVPPIPGNPDELTEVFQNLLENALKYSTPDTLVEVEVIRRESTVSGGRDRIDISIQDQGEGIESKHLPRLTERFYRVDKGRSREMGGTGLGLAISKHIINRHRGHITFKSEVGKGTRVDVTLRV